MAMSVGGDAAEETPMSDINTTPLVDVMLVLLIIFLIAVPVVIQTVKLTLPKVRFEPTDDQARERRALGHGDAGGNCQVYLGHDAGQQQRTARPGGDEAEGGDRAAGRASTPPDSNFPRCISAAT